MDALGHVNNISFMRYLECGRVAYRKDVLTLPITAATEEVWVLADIQCTFLGQLHYPNTTQVATRVNRLGNSSAELEAAIYVESAAQPVLTSKAVIVWFDLAQQRSVRIPQLHRDIIEAYEDGVSD